jgi:hypothetical protein
MSKHKTHAELLAEAFKKLEEYNVKTAYYYIFEREFKITGK